MACMYFDTGAKDELGRRRLLHNYRYELTNQLRRHFLEREQYDKLSNIYTNQLRQRLCIEFPEVAERKLDNIGVDGFNPTLGHIAGIKPARKFPKTTAGTGITEYSKNHAIELIRIQSKLLTIEKELKKLLKHPEFIPYMNVLEQFGFGVALSTLLLLYIYPFEKFLVNSKPYYRANHDISLRKFQAFLGFSYTYEESGDTSAKGNKRKKKWHGSDMVRAHLYAHTLIMICMKKRERIYLSENQRKVKEAWFYERVRTVTKGKETKIEKFPSYQSMGKDGICRLLFYYTRIIYSELIKELGIYDR